MVTADEADPRKVDAAGDSFLELRAIQSLMHRPVSDQPFAERAIRKHVHQERPFIPAHPRKQLVSGLESQHALPHVGRAGPLVESIVQLEAISHREFEVVFKDGSRSRVSRTYGAQSVIEERLGESPR